MSEEVEEPFEWTAPNGSRYRWNGANVELRCCDGGAWVIAGQDTHSGFYGGRRYERGDR
jgi:hypothetical protein